MFSASYLHKLSSAQQRRSQDGAALVLALVIVVLVTMLASGLSSDFLVDIKRVENQLHSQQAHALMRGAEGIARSVLQLDFSASKEKDHISEGWLDQRQDFPTDFGIISGTVCDLQGRFNINNLAASAANNRNDGQLRYTESQEIFIRLLQTLSLETPIEQQQAEDITNAVIDWVDGNSNTRSTGGAEDLYYSELDLPYRPANRNFYSASELRWVKGITAEIYQALERYIVALPEPTDINVNTASINVLRSFNENGQRQPLSEADVQSVISERDGDLPTSISLDSPEALETLANMNSGFDSVEDFVQSFTFTELPKQILDVKSDYFLLDTQAYFLDKNFQLRSVLHRDTDGKVTTIARSKNGWVGCSTIDNEIDSVIGSAREAS